MNGGGHVAAADRVYVMQPRASEVSNLLEYEARPHVRHPGAVRKWIPAVMIGLVVITIVGGALLYCSILVLDFLSRPIAPGGGGP
jgi:hypothetical protein